jgi:subtilase family serine protease
MVCLLTGTLYAQGLQRITQSVDNQAVVRLPGTTHPLATVANDRGRVAGGLAMDSMLLELKSSPEQETSLEQLLAEQQDPSSPRYREWLTPQQFGERFGASQQDLDVIANWLQDRGFRVNGVTEGRRTIEFSGTARQVEDAFQTEIHNYEVNGVRHVANATDIAIPEALAPVVGGIVSLHDFPVHPLYHRVGTPVTESARPGAAPAYNLSGGGHAIGPYDFATIYDVAALWNLSYDGTGETIAIAGHTNIKLTDVTAFRSYFGLPANNPQIIVNGTDPGIISADEETEADLDVEWSGAVAKGATVKFVVSKSTNSTDGLDLSNQYIINKNVASVMSLSFGECEAELGSESQFYNSLWSQAASQGISVFVAAGDTGSAGCDIPVSESSNGSNNTKPASGGLAVNGLASTPYNVAVGGTEFNEGSGSYWNSTMNAHDASAIGYIPEVVWQQSSYTTPGAAANNLYAGSGGVSILYGTPAWQTGNGVPAADPFATSQHHRYLPDVSLSAGGSDGYIMEQEDNMYLVGGTSVSSPSFAGIMAIINQYTGTHNGNPNLRFYPLAAQAPSVFHDVTSGTNAVPCAGGSPGCSAAAPSTNIGHMNGYSAGAGYDLATGWGSVDAYSLATHWSNVTAVPMIVSLSPNPMTGSTSSQTLTITGSGFQAGSGPTVVLGCTGATAGTVASATSTQIQVPVNVGTTARACTVQVTSGQASNIVSLQVVAPAGAAPAIASLSPNPMTGSSANQTLTINGSGFLSGLKVVLSYTGSTTTLQGSQIASVTASQIQVPVNVGTTARAWSVQVVNSNNQASNTASLAVVAPVVAPAIASLTPNPMTGSNANQVLTITGSGFQSGSLLKVLVSYTGYSATLQGAQLAFLSASQIEVLIDVGTTARTWSVQVVNPNGLATSVASLQVVAPPVPPAIASVSPNPMTGSASNQTITIKGSGFQSGSGLTVLVGYSSYTAAATQVKWVSSSQITASIDVGTAARNWLVEIVNPNGQPSNVATFQVSAVKTASK